MIKLSLLVMAVTFFCLYSFKDWFKSLCFLIVLMAFIQRPDMPKAILGIPGLNPFNILLLFVLMGWVVERYKVKIKWDVPKVVNYILVFYLFIVVVGFFRMLAHQSQMVDYYALMGMEYPSAKALFMDKVLNTIKWAIPGILLLDGCRSEKRIKLAVFSILFTYFLLALQVIKWMPLSAIIDGALLESRSRRVLDREIGYYRTDIAMMLSGAVWAAYSIKDYFSSKSIRIAIKVMIPILFLGLALTGGRTGYGTFIVIGLIMAYYKWRRIFIILPVFAIVVILLLPAAIDRFTQGFTPNSVTLSKSVSKDISSNDKAELFEVTAGRSFAWPFVIDKINKSPFLGYGREAMQTTGLSTYLKENYNESFPHPHNAYLQLIFDNGYLGSVPIFLFFFIFTYKAKQYFVYGNQNISVISGFSLAIILGQLISSVGAQSFYPVESSVFFWAAIGLILRIHIYVTQSNNHVRQKS